MYNEYTGQLEIHNVIHDYIENENKRLDRLTDEKIQRHYIQEIERLNIIRKQALQIILDDWYEKNTIPIEKIAISSDIRVKLFKVLIQGEDKE